MIDAFFWLVLAIALLEGARIARLEYKGGGWRSGTPSPRCPGDRLLAAALRWRPRSLRRPAAVRIVVGWNAKGGRSGRSLKSGLVASAMLVLASAASRALRTWPAPG